MRHRINEDEDNPAETTGTVMTQDEIERRLEAIGYALETHSAHLLRLAHQRATALFQKRFDGYAVTPTQVAVLATLLRHGAMPQINLGRLTAIDTATLSPMLRRLQNDAMIERLSSDQDQRVNMVQLTKKGADFVLEILPDSQRLSEQMLAPLKPRDRSRFLEMLKLLG